MELGFWIPILSRILDSLTCTPDSKPQDSGFHKQKFHGFRNPDSLTWDDVMLTKRLAQGFHENHKVTELTLIRWEEIGSPLMLPDTSMTKARLFSDLRFKHFAKMSSPTVERMSFRNLLVAWMARSAAISWRLKNKEKCKSSSFLWRWNSWSDKKPCNLKIWNCIKFMCFCFW